MAHTQTTEVAVIGAGPYGLAIAAHLRNAGIEHRIFGQEPMSSWRHNMPKGMLLKSPYDWSSLYAPGAGSKIKDYCDSTGHPGIDKYTQAVPLDLFVDYCLWFQQRLAGHLQRVDVRRVATAERGFDLSLADGERVLARRVVLATGHMAFCRMPDELKSLAHPSVTHASQHSDLAVFAGKTVAVLGGGQSALENAVLLAESGAEVHLLVRSPREIPWGAPLAPKGFLHRMVKPESPLGAGWSHVAMTDLPDLVSYLPAPTRLYLMRSILGPGGGWWLKDRFDRSGIHTRLGTVVEQARPTGGKVVLRLRSDASRSTLGVDHLMAGTGYVVDVDNLKLLEPKLRETIARIRGAAAPRLSRTFESSVPGLYFTGLAAAPTFGPLLRFVAGSGFASRALCRAFGGFGRTRSAPSVEMGQPAALEGRS